MTSGVVQILTGVLDEGFASRFTRTTNPRVQLTVHGLPDSLLRELFLSLTAQGTANHGVPGIASPELLVLLVTPQPKVQSQGASALVSHECGWEAVIHARNSWPLVLVLSSEQSWATVPESVENATEPLGPGAVGSEPRLSRSPVWGLVVDKLASRFGSSGISPEGLSWAVGNLVSESIDFSPLYRLELPWQVLNRLASATPSAEEFYCSVGLPSRSDSVTTIQALREAFQTIDSVAEFVNKEGVDEAFTQLRNTSTGSTLVAELEDFKRAITEAKAIGVDFIEAPCWVFRATGAIPRWIRALTNDVLTTILGELDRPTRRLRTRLACTNALNRPEPLNGEPWLVLDSAEFQVADAQSNLVSEAQIVRGVGAAAAALPPSSGSPPTFTDSQIPQQSRKVRYVAVAQGLDRSRPLYVISLERFKCHGTARVAEALENKPPVADSRTQSWRQRILVPISGVHEVEVLHDPVWTVSEVSFKGETLRPASGSTPERAVFRLNIEDGDTATVGVVTAAGVVAGWQIEFGVDRSDEELPSSTFDALVVAHQRNGRIPPVAPRDTLIRTLEADYLASPLSWRPLLAGWSHPQGGLTRIDWQVPTTGDLGAIPTARALSSPPAELLESREQVRQLLSQSQLRVPEMDFGNPLWAEAISRYVGAYTRWLSEDPESAPWFDVVAIFGALENLDAGTFSPTQEPVAMLLSPLHPLRIGWRNLADRTLRVSLSETPRPCPAAGLIDPHVIPDSTGFPLRHGDGTPQWRAFFSIGTEEDSWALLINRLFLDEGNRARQQVQTVLDWIGMRPRSMAGGFSQTQAIASLQEVADILPARATLRVGIVGAEEVGSSSVEGVFEWSQDNLGEEQPGCTAPFSVEVHDARRAPVSPSAGELTELYDSTHERLQWFRHPDTRLPVPCDLVILDQLGFREPRGIDASPRTPASPGVLTRIRVKVDLEQAAWLRESRILRSVGEAGREAAPIDYLCSLFESLASRDNSISHLEYHPNQEALGERLSGATFLAVSSTRLDPACLIRGAQGRHGHLWDYALPAIVGTDEEGSGYYLIARPTEAMRKSVAEATRVLGAPSPPDPEELLREASRRGIPVLKRLAAGGSESRGELGTLLAVRLIQDCFRGEPSGARVPGFSGSTIGLILAVDPYADLFAEIGRALRHPSRARPDLFLAIINLTEECRPSIDILPIEIKYRTHPLGNADLDDALSQASEFAPLLKRLWEDPLPSALWTTCARTILANMLDEGFRIYADENVHGQSPDRWVRAHEAVLAAVMSGAATVRIATEGRLLGFGAWPTSDCLDQDNDGIEETLRISSSDCIGLLSSPQVVSAGLEAAFLRVFPARPSGEVPAPPPTAPPPRGIAPIEPERPPQEVKEPAPIESIPVDKEVAARPKRGEEPTELERPAVPPTEAGEVVPTQVVAPESGGATRVPATVRTRVAAAFHGFIGNEEAVAVLTRELRRALLENPPHLPKNLLFTGSPSTGKTELARRVARVLDLPLVRLDGRGLVSLERLVELLDNVLGDSGRRAVPAGRYSGLPAFDYPPSIVFVDEIHLVPRPVQEGLLLVLERDDRRGILRDRVVLVNRVTFLFATTRASQLDRAFKSRCTEVQLNEYTAEQVAQMVALKHPDWPPAIHASLAVNGRMIPRIALELADTLEAELEVTDHPELPIEAHLREVLRTRQILRLGLTAQDLHYLSELERQGRPIGADALLGILGAVDPARVQEEVEPYLVRQKLIKLGRTGREITPAGRAYLAEMRRQGYVNH